MCRHGRRCQGYRTGSWLSRGMSWCPGEQGGDPQLGGREKLPPSLLQLSDRHLVRTQTPTEKPRATRLVLLETDCSHH